MSSLPAFARSLTNKPVHPVGLGCMSLSWAYGSPITDDEGAAVLKSAIDAGYNHFDTARVYGVGHNETLIGKTLAATFRANREHFVLASKTGIIANGKERRIDCKPDSIRAACDESLRLLDVEYIDLYYLHRRDFTVPIEESVGALSELVAAGKIRGIGLSEMSADTLRAAAKVHPIAAMQTEYSPWTRQAEIAVLDACKEMGTTFVAFSPVGRGALANGVPDPAALPDTDIRKSMPRFIGDNWVSNQALIADFNKLAAVNGLTPAQLSMGWVLSQGDHIVVIPGTANSAHVQENIATPARISVELAAQVDALINQSTVAGHRYPPVYLKSIDTEDFPEA